MCDVINAIRSIILTVTKGYVFFEFFEFLPFINMQAQIAIEIDKDIALKILVTYLF